MALATAAEAAPFAISHTGTLSGSTFPEINNGQPYTVTVVVDNGGSQVAGQTWAGEDLRCVLLQMNGTGNVAFAQDMTLPASTPTILTGSISTDAGGNLTDNFTAIELWTVTGGYTAAGFTPVPTISWYLNSGNAVFYDDTAEFGDASGGTQMAPEFWSAPRPFTGQCVARTRSTTAAPALGTTALLSLAGLLSVGGIARLRRARCAPGVRGLS